MKQGFFIIEFLVYLVIFSFLSMLLMTTVVSHSCSLRLLGQKNNESMEVLCALDSLTRLLELAPADKERYWVMTDTECIWHDQKAQKDRGVVLEENNLYALTGQWQKELGRWRSRRKTVLARGLGSCKMSYHTSKAFKKVWMRVITLLIKKNGAEAKKSIGIVERVTT